MSHKAEARRWRSLENPAYSSETSSYCLCKAIDATAGAGPSGIDSPTVWVGQPCGSRWDGVQIASW